MCPGWPQTHFKTQAGLELKHLLSQFAMCWARSTESGCVSLWAHQYGQELAVYLNFTV